MTLEEYAQKVGNALRNAHNNKDMVALEAKFAEADRKLAAAKISDARTKAFWSDVRKAMSAGRWLVEEQANSSLIALMQAIQQGLAKRERK